MREWVMGLIVLVCAIGAIVAITGPTITGNAFWSKDNYYGFQKAPSITVDDVDAEDTTDETTDEEKEEEDASEEEEEEALDESDEATETVEEEGEETQDYTKTANYLALGKTRIPTISERYGISIPTTPADGADACCTEATDAVNDLTDKIAELEDKIAELEERNSGSCPNIDITSGSCEKACEEQDLRCVSALKRRVVTEEDWFGNRFENEFTSQFTACDDDWYFPNDPDVVDTITCVCC